ncbi:cyclin-dependent kinase [Acrasis kona]|uniref:cyclin-dependent kinase n=1 Tax=Acrasis kona TaxID=1008807 RepID=A0AAW2ZMW8_9EUKA
MSDKPLTMKQSAGMTNSPSRKPISTNQPLKPKAFVAEDRPQLSTPSNPFNGKCRSVESFEKLNKIGEGTYGTVYRARDRRTGQIVALKKIKMNIEKDGMPVTALREISLLNTVNDHPNIVKLYEVVVGYKLSSVFLVFEYCEHDVSILLDSRKNLFSESEIKCLLRQLLKAMDYMHKQYIIHRDIKLSNLLYNGHGQLKVADFGLARFYGTPAVNTAELTSVEQQNEKLTPKVQTLWYRAPELLLGVESYSTAVDMWAVGCIFGELLLSRPVMPGKQDLNQLELIYELLGEPNEKIWPGYLQLPAIKNLKKDENGDVVPIVKVSSEPSESGSRLRDRIKSVVGQRLSRSGYDLLESMLQYDPNKRITAADALNHEYFSTPPHTKPIDMMPVFPSYHTDTDYNHRRRHHKESEESIKPPIPIHGVSSSVAAPSAKPKARIESDRASKRPRHS